MYEFLLGIIVSVLSWYLITRHIIKNDYIFYRERLNFEMKRARKLDEGMEISRKELNDELNSAHNFLDTMKTRTHLCKKLNDRCDAIESRLDKIELYVSTEW